MCRGNRGDDRAGATTDLAFVMAPNVVFPEALGVEAGIRGRFEHHQQFCLVGMQLAPAPVESDKARWALEVSGEAGVPGHRVWVGIPA